MLEWGAKLSVQTLEMKPQMNFCIKDIHVEGVNKIIYVFKYFLYKFYIYQIFCSLQLKKPTHIE